MSFVVNARVAEEVVGMTWHDRGPALLSDDIIVGGTAIEIITGKNFDGLVFSADKTGKIIPVKQVKAEEVEITDSAETPLRSFLRRVGVRRSKEGHLVTIFPDNKVEVLVFNPGSVDRYQVSIVGRNGSFFLSVPAIVLGAPVFADGKNVICPQFSGWPEIHERIVLRYREADLPALPDDYARPGFPLPAAPNHGVVEWYDVARGFGLAWVKGLDGERVSARIFWKNISGNPGFAPDPGTEISFEFSEAAKSDTFKLELFGVKSVS